jgi:hypothetical protein
VVRWELLAVEDVVDGGEEGVGVVDAGGAAVVFPYFAGGIDEVGFAEEAGGAGLAVVHDAFGRMGGGVDDDMEVVGTHIESVDVPMAEVTEFAEGTVDEVALFACEGQGRELEALGGLFVAFRIGREPWGVILVMETVDGAAGVAVEEGAVGADGDEVGKRVRHGDKFMIVAAVWQAEMGAG